MRSVMLIKKNKTNTHTCFWLALDSKRFHYLLMLL